ncbi:hypothetical protein CONCODRAFT_116631 [Conidiobolus coronatus NRRL 28638]|uniref:RanBP-type and C3HC4-type zinc finger-containing protein 1 n=1 Tax=Conidiobolus coronatus (strain ATCC 28846 / CBS 209.66 / NRRL 28638) TaxID=796925 RepID=A0A137PE74_CONC2|nr:hypothetical protein CONCODRAFT_116631 [Conidiobolus coronatus NRRL 28638]|eukprot:KXN73309.1 hypothetical protein CONCODRAFT_116631 [Conidiobolus coronatus NRRL 28638]
MTPNNADFNEQVQNLTAKLTCLICKDIYKNASTISECGDTFCDKCIREHISDFNSCYDCGSFAIPVNVKSNPPIRNLVELLHELRTLGSSVEFDDSFSNISNFNLRLSESDHGSARLSAINEESEKFENDIIPMEFTQLDNVPVKSPFIMDDIISLSQAPSNEHFDKKHSSNSQNFDFTSTQDPAQKATVSEPRNLSIEFNDSTTQLSSIAKHHSEIDEFMEFSPIKTQKAANDSPIRMLLSQVGPSDEPLNKKRSQNSETVTSTQMQFQKPSLQDLDNHMEFSEDGMLNDTFLASTQNPNQQQSNRKTTGDQEAFLPNSQEFSVIHSHAPPSTSGRAENDKVTQESRHSEDMELCTPQNTQHAQKIGILEKISDTNDDTSDTSFNGIDEPAMLSIEITPSEDIPTASETIKDPVKVDPKSAKEPESLDKFDYIEVASNSQFDESTFKNQTATEDDSAQADTLELPITKSDVSQINEMVKTKLNIKKSRKRSIQEPDLKKFKTEKASSISNKLSEDASGMSTPVSKSKTTSSKTKTIPTPDSDTSEWACLKCTLLNSSKRRKCRVCNSLRFSSKNANGKKGLKVSSPEADSSFVKNTSPAKAASKLKTPKLFKDSKQSTNSSSKAKSPNTNYAIKSKPWGRVYLATTGLDDDLKERLKQDITYLKAIGVNISLTTSKPYDQKTTHLVGSYRELENGCLRSNTYLFGILLSQNILSYDCKYRKNEIKYLY